MKRRAAMLVIALIVATPTATADPVPEAAPAVDLTRPLKLLSGSTVTTDGGSTLRLPPGRFLTESVWERLDAEVVRLQAAETRLTAENKSFRASIDAGAASGPSWWMLAGAFALGAATAVYIGAR